MLFTDIEGSTLHLRALGPDYAVVLSDQRRIMRSAIEAHGGHEMGTEGDSFFVVFDSPAEATAMAIEAQRGLHANAWPGGATVRVRMGLHVGDLVRHEEGYMGLDLNRAARIASTANGAQIVISDALRRELPVLDGVAFRDLGHHRLKDLPGPEHIFQLIVDGLPDIAMPIKSLGAPTNLPAPRAALVGRSDELDTVAGLVRRTRVVTLTGPGGVGKTSLSLAVAASVDAAFPGGVYFVALEEAREADAMWAAIATAIDAAGDGDPKESVSAALASSSTLLVLDNLEQLGPSAALVVSDLLDGTAASVLATSRGPLRLRGEQHFPLEPLELERAIELFVAEARRVRPSFSLTGEDERKVAAIVARVDGLPLAVELVASRVRLLGLDAILRSLDDQLAVSSRDVDRPDRQRTLRAAVAWSHDLLDPELQQAFARLSVFAGGATVDAAAAVLEQADPLDTLDALADVSLVSFGEGVDGDPRVTMLGAVRSFAAAQLAVRADEEHAARARHAAHLAEFVEEAEGRLHGPDQLAWADRLTAEHDNLRAAFEWALAVGDGASAAGRISAALGWFWYTHGRAAEGRAWLERAPETPRVLQALGVLQQQQGDNDRALESFERALELCQAAGDRYGQSRALNSLGITHWAEGRLGPAEQALRDSAAIATEIGDERRQSSALTNLGIVLLTAGRVDEAVDVLSNALSIDRRHGNAWAIAVDLANLGMALIRRGDVTEGHALAAEALPTAVDLDDPDLIASAIEACASAVAANGDHRRALELVGGADRIRAEAGVPRPSMDEGHLEREIGPARAAMSRAESDEAMARGALLTVDQLVELARRS